MAVTIYLVRSDVDIRWGVVHSYSEASEWVDIASELAALAGQETRGQRIQQIWLGLYDGRKPRVLRQDETDHMLDLLDGLEMTLVGRVVDANWRVRPDQLPELRARTTTLDLDESRRGAELHAVAEGMSRIVALRKVFQLAKERGLLVAVG